MFCTKCGSPLGDGQKFCVSCGAPVGGGSSEPHADAAQPQPGPSDETAALQEKESPAPAPATGFSTDEEPPHGESTGFSTDEDVPADEGGRAPERSEGAAAAPTQAMDAPVPPADTSGVDVAAEGAFPDAMYAGPQGGYSPGATYGQQPKEGVGTGVKAVAIVAVALAVVAVVVALAVFVFGVGGGSKVIEADAEEPTECTLITRIFPEGEDGEPLDDYDVTVVDSKTGEVVDVVEVRDDKGFAFEDVSGDVSDGQYDLEVKDNKTGKSSSYGTYNVSKDNGKAKDKVSAKPSDSRPSAGKPSGGATGTAPEGKSPDSDPKGSDGSDKSDDGKSTDDQGEDAKAKSMYQLYLDTVNEQVEKYGPMETATKEDGAVVQAQGVSFVQLVDFDKDGTDELLTVYYDENQVDPDDLDSWGYNHPDGYRAEVWAYDGDKVEKVMEAPVDYSNGGFAYLRVYSDDDGCKLAPVEFKQSSDDAGGDMVTTVRSIKDGKLEQTEFVMRDVYTSDSSYLVDGDEVDQDEYEDRMQELLGECDVENYSLTTPASTYDDDHKGDGTDDSGRQVTTFTPDETVETALDTVDALELMAAGKEPKAQTAGVDRGGAKNVPAALKEEYADIVRDYEETYGPAGIEANQDYYYLTGLAYAELVDLGYDADCLVVCYFEDGAVEGDEPGRYGQGYAVDVWAPAEDDPDDVELVFSGGALYSIFMESTSWVGLENDGVHSSRLVTLGGDPDYPDEYCLYGKLASQYTLAPMSDRAWPDEFEDDVNDNEDNYDINALTFSNAHEAEDSVLTQRLEETKDALGL